MSKDAIAAQGPLDRGVSHPTVKDFERWEPNTEVSVWGRGKATADKNDCPMDAPPKAKYKGDCDNCDMFMGIRFPKDMDEPPTWGDRFKACCWAKVANDQGNGPRQAQLAEGPR